MAENTEREMNTSAIPNRKTYAQYESAVKWEGRKFYTPHQSPTGDSFPSSKH